MKKSSKLKINIALMIVNIIICGISLFAIFYAQSNDSINRWFFLSVIALLAFAFNLGEVLNYLNILGYEKQAKNLLTYVYSEVKISAEGCVPLPIETAITENNIIFYAKLRKTKNNDIIVCIIAKRNGEFFAEELLTVKGPMFMSCKDFLNTFEK